MVLVLGLLFSVTGSARAISLVADGNFVISNDLLQNLLAKEICSCVYVAQVGGPQMPILKRAQLCLEHSQLPMSPGLLNVLLNESLAPDTQSVEVSPQLVGAVLGLFQGEGARAQYRGPKVGCTLDPAKK